MTKTCLSVYNLSLHCWEYRKCAMWSPQDYFCSKFVTNGLPHCLPKVAWTLLSRSLGTNVVTKSQKMLKCNNKALNSKDLQKNGRGILEILVPKRDSWSDQGSTITGATVRKDECKCVFITTNAYFVSPYGTPWKLRGFKQYQSR